MLKYVNTRLLRNSNFENNIEMSSHPDLTIDVIKSKPDVVWKFHDMMNHPNFDLEWVSEFPRAYWNWNKLSEIANIEFVSKNPKLFWNWRIITSNTSINDIMNHLELPWDFAAMNFNIITEDDIPFFKMYEQHIPIWKWKYFAQDLTWKALKMSMDLPWIFDIFDVQISTEEFMPEDVWILRAYENLCDWVKLTIQVHIDIINANPELPWRMDYIQWNKTTWKTPTIPIEISIREWTAANTIKRFWKRSISDPTFRCCKLRLERELKELESL